MKCPLLQVYFFDNWIFFMATILQLKVAKRRLFKKWAWSADMWIHIQCHCFNKISIVPQFWYNSFITCYWLDLLIAVIHLPCCIYWSLCSVKTLLSQVLKLRSTNWGFSGTQGSAGAYLPHPANDEYYISDYSLAMVC